MATKTKTTAKRKRAPVRRRTPKKAAPRTRGVLPSECKLDELPPAAAEVAARVEREGGLLIGSYYEPLGRNPLLLAALPISEKGAIVTATKGKANKPVEVQLTGTVLEAQRGHRARKGKLVDSKLKPPFSLRKADTP